MARSRLAAVGVALLAIGMNAQAAEPEFSGQIRTWWMEQRANANGPLAQADALVPGLVALPRSNGTLEAELRASGHGITAVGTLHGQHDEGGPTSSHGTFNELYASRDAWGWAFSAGKKIVSWDVGYGFRPNDVVEQEPRRTLLATTPEGRAVLTAEHFSASTAWTFVLVNPTKSRDALGPDEPALAARVYQRDGALDWHGFARWGARTHASLGGAVAWVASDSVELHASARLLTRADTLAIDPGLAAGALASTNPWQAASVSRPVQALVGGTWTNEAQLSVLVEAWWDGTALSDRQWDDWAVRNQALARIAVDPPPGLPAQAIAGNIAMQATAFTASTNLRRANLYARASWQFDKWQPVIDMLYTPADRGRIVTASLGWQGDRVRIDAGVRVYGGPSDALLAQVPTRRIAYIAGTWPF